MPIRVQQARLGFAVLSDVGKMSQYVVFVAAGATQTRVDIGVIKRYAVNQRSSEAGKLVMCLDRAGP